MYQLPRLIKNEIMNILGTLFVSFFMLMPIVSVSTSKLMSIFLILIIFQLQMVRVHLYLHRNCMQDSGVPTYVSLFLYFMKRESIKLITHKLSSRFAKRTQSYVPLIFIHDLKRSWWWHREWQMKIRLIVLLQQ